MFRSKILGYIAILFSLFFISLFFSAFIYFEPNYNISQLNNFLFYSIAFPLALVTLFVIGTGFWIGWTILSIKVVPPMPEIVEKKDYTKPKAIILCLTTFLLACFFLYGLYLKSFWALAIPAALITFVFLGAIFWVGLAIITTRSTLPEKK